MSGPIVALEIPAAVVDAIAERVRAELVEEQQPAADPWLDVKRAAEHLSCKPQRIYDLVQQRRLEPARDGSRLLFRASWLDAYVEQDGGVR